MKDIEKIVIEHTRKTKRDILKAIRRQRSRVLMGMIETLESQIFPRGERPWCVQCIKRIKKAIKKIN